jgi:hypothetical protein
MNPLQHNPAKTFFFGTFLEPQMSADKRGFHGFLISVHLRPSAVPFLGCGFAALGRLRANRVMWERLVPTKSG